MAPTPTPMISTLSPGYKARPSGKYATTVVVVSLRYSCQPTTPAIIASTTTEVATTTEVRETLGSRMFRILKIVDIAYPPVCTFCDPVRAPGGAAGGTGTGVPSTSGGARPGTPAIGMPGVGGSPFGVGADVATSGAG